MFKIILILPLLFVFLLQGFLPAYGSEARQNLGSVAAERKHALDLLLDGKSAEAQETLAKLAKDGDSDSLMDLAAFYVRKANLDEALKLCEKAQRTKNDCPQECYTPAMIRLGIAECKYRQHLLEQSKLDYEESLKLLSKRDPGLCAGFALEGLAGSYLGLHDYKNAAETYKEVALLYKDLYGSDDINYAWALLRYAETSAKIGDRKNGKLAYEKSIWIFRDTNSKRLCEEYKAISPEKIRKLVFGQGDLETYRNADQFLLSGKSEYASRTAGNVDFPDCVWKRNFRKIDPPGWVWLDPTQPVRATIVCIHGLGLHHRSFESFAKRIAPLGFMTVSFDVRGFGTFLAHKGQEKLDMVNCVRDMKAVISILRRDNPEMPLFVLGESMGGAIALRIGEQIPNEINGLICSVPSGSRYGAKKTALKVAWHFITGRYKPIDIGTQVVSQATSEADLREQWINDPSARMHLSPNELLKFDLFMGQNVKVAKKIDRLPVILFQGDEDRLVKKQGTYDLFEAIKTKQKTLVLLGYTEHLIFEAGQFKDDITLGVIGWMKAHGAK